MKTDVDHFEDRVAKVVTFVGGVTELSTKVGVSRATVEKWRKGLSDPSRSNLLALADCANVSLTWLATGEGPMQSGESADLEAEFMTVPRYDAAASCGGGAFVDEAPILDQIPFTQAFIGKKLGRTNTKGLILIDAQGDSMEPTIHDGGLIMVDTQKTTLTSAVYAFSYDGALFVKRLNHLPDALEARSDNKEYPPFTIEKHQMNHFRTIGRVVWVGHMI